MNNLKNYSETSITNTDILLPNENSEEFKQNLLDIKSMGFLGEYYTNKTSASVELEFFKVTGDERYQY